MVSRIAPLRLGIRMAYCFVIQPFDGGKFDKRYRDVFEPAIRKAGLEPYRVDNDPSASILIEQIEKGIRNASVCFVDITIDNPNVWFELGYALASKKEICLICSEERNSKFPFDVQHRSIIKYDVESLSDYHALQNKITARLVAISEISAKLAAFNALSPVREEGSLSQHEKIVMATIFENRDGPGDAVTHGVVKNHLDRLGYNNIALNIGIEKLIRKGMLKVNRGEDYNGNVYVTYEVDDKGMNWMIANYEQLDFSAPSSYLSGEGRGC